MVATIGSERPGKYIGCVVDFDWIVIKKITHELFVKTVIKCKANEIIPSSVGISIISDYRT